MLQGFSGRVLPIFKVNHCQAGARAVFEQGKRPHLANAKFHCSTVASPAHFAGPGE